ncbi:hypothetical protein QCA50_001157 [Cerrena zonata]|uniref:FHA domain-containing protein n=1 Tax=Cerrena zonata TaxID=2478898 RepID=A0AAW0GY86_9APHY
MAQDPDGDLVSSYLINRSPRPPPMDNVENATHAPGEVRGTPIQAFVGGDNGANNTIFVLGLVLRVDGWGEQQPITLRFYKDRTETIHIGRKSAQNPGKYVSTEDRALFQCAVVSRQHAKLTFTEGNVCIVAHPCTLTVILTLIICV